MISCVDETSAHGTSFITGAVAKVLEADGWTVPPPSSSLGDEDWEVIVNSLSVREPQVSESALPLRRPRCWYMLLRSLWLITVTSLVTYISDYPFLAPLEEIIYPSARYSTGLRFDEPVRLLEAPPAAIYEVDSICVTMPAAWDRRYLQQTTTTGCEVLIVKKCPHSTVWAVYMPDHSLATVSSSSWTCSPARYQGVDLSYQASPVLTDAQKAAAMTRFTEMCSRGVVPVSARTLRTGGQPRLLSYGFRMVSSALVVPGQAARLIRWSMRSRSRFAAFLAVSYMCYEVLDNFGVFRRIDEVTTAVGARYTAFRERVETLGGVLLTVFQTAENFNEAIREFCEPWRFYSYVLAVIVLIAGCNWEYQKQQDGEDSPTSSPGSSAAGSPMGSPAQSPRENLDPTVLEMKTALARQEALLSKVAQNQMSINERLDDAGAEARASELVRQARAADHRAWSDKDRSALEEMRMRLEDFSRILKEDRSAKGPPSSPEKFHIGSTPASPATPHGVGSAPASSAEVSPDYVKVDERKFTAADTANGWVEVQEAIRRLEQQSQTPQQRFVPHLRNVRPLDEDAWNREFPIGYRTRIAPSFLTDVFSSGKKGKDWAKDFIRDHCMSEYPPAKDLVATMAALDTMIFADESPDVLNKFSTERLAKKGYAYYKLSRASRRRPTGSDQAERAERSGDLQWIGKRPDGTIHLWSRSRTCHRATTGAWKRRFVARWSVKPASSKRGTSWQSASPRRITHRPPPHCVYCRGPWPCCR